MFPVPITRHGAELARSFDRPEHGVLTLARRSASRAAQPAVNWAHRCRRWPAAGQAPIRRRSGADQAPIWSSGQRGRTSKAWSIDACPAPACSRIAAASAIIAPLSVHSASSG